MRYNKDKRQEILRATSEAARLKNQFPLGKRTSFDIIGATETLGIPFFFKPLSGLWGAALTIDDKKGILITSKLPLSIQRFTLAHELGHLLLGHKLSLDESLDDNIYKSTKFITQIQERAANTFASEILISKPNIANTFKKQGWEKDLLKDPNTVYQLSLRLGVSYEATCNGLTSLDLIDEAKKKELLKHKVKEIKYSFLTENTLDNSWSNVWTLSTNDSNTIIEASPEDVFILNIEENSTAGYLWEMDNTLEDKIKIFSNNNRLDEKASYGSKTMRSIQFTINKEGIHRIYFDHKRPWSGETDSYIEINVNNYGKEVDGLARRIKDRRLALYEN
ncbi:ImmA/IrrE family metallo-endopeptidase [Leptospira weilii]|uniref:ImmA/IrrE family metallo-endopeptidase n=1 Tax=Leptospira weilii TaxID=28184 RepID=UPI000304C669|nr:ImmA/IrrE family metallo-endopeptidase [Leptospira weilii]OMI16988.1 hypothetical protein BUQ74_12375 [Leptospira weilii serovar Heyan]ULH27423.1 ImmA/IrrE family metallo-endopeptidase [Leptospira weilii]UPY77590.1 ImmA/IrrE family metallo-endopeptidase [Leptospira weilii]